MSASNAPANPHVTAQTPWYWTAQTSAGTAVEVPADLLEAFESQAEAESWLGEYFGDLTAAGADEVTLLESERVAYSMSLHE